MVAALQLDGQVFGYLTVLSRTSRRPRSWWLCRCACGAEKEIAGAELQSGGAKSCGCKRVEMIVAGNTQHGHQRGTGPTRTYNTWASMMTRCTNPKSSKWPLYGGRGITVCERWRTFANFLADIGERPAGRTIDREDNDGNYEPGNCRWATPREQALNRAPKGTRS